MAKIKKRLVLCERCDHQFISAQEKPKCGRCGKSDKIREVDSENQEYTIEKEGRIEKEPKEQKATIAEAQTNKDYHVPVAQTGITFGAKDLALAELLVQSGFAKNMSELMRNSLHLSGALLNLGALTEKTNGGNGKMAEEKKEMTAEEMIEKTFKNQMLQAQIDNLKSGKSNLLETMILMDKLGSQKSQGPDPQMQYMMQTMQQQIADLKTQLVMSQPKSPLNDTATVIQLFQAMGGKKDELSSLLEKIENIRAEKDKAIAQQNADTNKQVEALRTQLEAEKQMALMKELSELKQQITSGLQNSGVSQKIRDKIEAQIEKKLDTAVSGIDGKKDKSEIFVDMVTGVIEKIKEPIIEPMGREWAKNIRAQREAEEAMVAAQQIPRPTATSFQQKDIADLS